MAFNGSGVFVVNSTGQPVVTGTTILASVFNAYTADVATALSNCVTRDGQSPATANLPMGTFRHTGVGNAVARTDYAAAGQAQDSAFLTGTVGGTANAITLTLSPAITAYAEGQLFNFVPTAANTGATTLAVNGLTASSVTRRGAAIAANELLVGFPALVRRTGSTFEILSTNISHATNNTLIGQNTFTSNLFVVNSTASLNLSNSGGPVVITASGANSVLVTGTTISLDGTVITDLVRPAADNTFAVGTTSFRYTEVWAVDGSINTSDAREKRDVADSDLGLDFINALRPVSFSWNAREGKHYGLIAQEIEQTLAGRPFDGLKKPDDAPMGLNYGELIAPLIKAIQELSAEVAALKKAAS